VLVDRWERGTVIRTDIECVTRYQGLSSIESLVFSCHEGVVLLGMGSLGVLCECGLLVELVGVNGICLAKDVS
jgi:hypothetical protein